MCAQPENANIVRVLGLYRVVQCMALVTEYVQGRSLLAFLLHHKGGEITELHLCNFAVGIARGMRCVLASLLALMPVCRASIRSHLTNNHAILTHSGS